MFSDEDIKEFRKIYKEEFKEDLSPDEARTAAWPISGDIRSFVLMENLSDWLKVNPDVGFPHHSPVGTGDKG